MKISSVVELSSRGSEGSAGYGSVCGGGCDGVMSRTVNISSTIELSSRSSVVDSGIDSFVGGILSRARNIRSIMKLSSRVSEVGSGCDAKLGDDSSGRGSGSVAVIGSWDEEGV